MIWVAGRSPTLVSQNLKATTLTYLAIEVPLIYGNLYLFEAIINPIVGMPVFPRTKDGGCPPATANFELIELPLLCLFVPFILLPVNGVIVIPI